VAALSGLWTQDALSLVHGIRETVVFAGSAISVYAAWERSRSRRAQRRLQLLAAVAAVSDRELGLRETARSILQLLVPDVADACVIEVLRGDGAFERLSLGAAGDQDLARDAAGMSRASTSRCARGAAASGGSCSRARGARGGATASGTRASPSRSATGWGWPSTTPGWRPSWPRPSGAWASPWTRWTRRS
jgi:hypothetical protein